MDAFCMQLQQHVARAAITHITATHKKPSGQGEHNLHSTAEPNRPLLLVMPGMHIYTNRCIYQMPISLLYGYHMYHFFPHHSIMFHQCIAVCEEAALINFYSRCLPLGYLYWKEVKVTDVKTADVQCCSRFTIGVHIFWKRFTPLFLDTSLLCKLILPQTAQLWK